jgi:hypothetical protein
MKRLDELKLEYIKSILDKLEYGSININVHDGEIVQIDTIEKIRFKLAKTSKAR